MQDTPPWSTPLTSSPFVQLGLVQVSEDIHVAAMLTEEETAAIVTPRLDVELLQVLQFRVRVSD